MLTFTAPPTPPPPPLPPRLALTDTPLSLLPDWLVLLDAPPLPPPPPTDCAKMPTELAPAVTMPAPDKEDVQALLLLTTPQTFTRPPLPPAVPEPPSAKLTAFLPPEFEVAVDEPPLPPPPPTDCAKMPAAFTPEVKMAADTVVLLAPLVMLTFEPAALAPVTDTMPPLPPPLPAPPSEKLTGGFLLSLSVAAAVTVAAPPEPPPPPTDCAKMPVALAPLVLMVLV